MRFRHVGLSIAMLIMVTSSTWAVNSLSVIHEFNSIDGADAYSNVIVDSAGNLFATTAYGGRFHLGSVVEFTPQGDGQWAEQVLYTFSGGSDGGYSYSALVFDAAGNLYGTTFQGGDFEEGTVYRLSPGGNGQWTETVLHSFHVQDGANPYASLIFDSTGKNLYGTTLTGGSHSGGTVFELSPGSNGEWTETVLYSFDNVHGSGPYANVTFDAGSLYGTTLSGGNLTACDGQGCGVIFQLKPGANGKWTPTVLHAFDGKDGASPYAGLVTDSSGNLYGTTYGYEENEGNVFELIRDNKTWKGKILHSFSGPDGSWPRGSLVVDSGGNVYGTTSGYPDADGNVFKLSPGANGKWTETVLATFNEQNGEYPYAGLVFGPGGALFGTTYAGGNLQACSGGCGVVFSIQP